MVLVPLGVSMSSWTSSIDSNPKSSTDKKSFTDNSGSNSFHRVGGISHGTSDSLLKKHKKTSSKLNPRIISPIQQVLDQTKEKEKRADGPDTTSISFNMAATSSGMSNKGKKSNSSSKTTKKKTSTGSTIKRLQRKRNSQSKRKLGTSKKSSTTSRLKNKKKL